MADTNKTTKAAEAVEETVAEKAPVKKTAAKRTTAKKTSTAKAAAETAEEKAPVKKAPAKKAPAKKAAAKKTTAKKAAPAEPETSVVIQFNNKNVAASALVEEVKQIWAAEGHDAAELKDIKVYLNVDESKAYYVINGNGNPTGVIEL